MTKTVLIVDDNTFVRQALCEIFERESDFEVCGEAEDGRQAVAAAICLHPDLVVLDISMPVMNGLDAARVLRALLPTLPLILYSAGVDEAVQLQARSIGMSEVVSKGRPVSILISKAKLCRGRAVLGTALLGRVRYGAAWHGMGWTHS
jgi:two-component system, chemotaxis family, chemotaxis protein CheY